MDLPSKYGLRITAGPEYHKHVAVPVNSTQPLVITTDAATITLTVHIKDYRGAPAPAQSSWPRRGPINPPSSTPRSAPPNSAYFASAQHATARYGLRFSLTPHRPFAASDVELGNDFDAPVRALLPPGFAAALRVVSTVVDPGLRGDPYADRPYLYGPLVSSANVMRVGPAVMQKCEEGESRDTRGDGGAPMELDLTEGGEGQEAERVRREAGVPDEAAARRKWFLDAENKKGFTFEEGRTYDFDFFNGYLDFNGETLRLVRLTQELTLHDLDFTLKLPMGFTFDLLKHMGDEKIPPLR